MQNHNIQICILIQLRFLRGDGDGESASVPFCKGFFFAFPPRFHPPHMKNFAKVESSSVISLCWEKSTAPQAQKLPWRLEVQDVEMQKSQILPGGMVSEAR